MFQPCRDKSIHVCGKCNKKFLATTPAQKCCHDCTISRQNTTIPRPPKLKTWFKKICVVCGEKFETDRANKKCCSPDCTVTNYEQNVKLRAQEKKRGRLAPPVSG